MTKRAQKTRGARPGSGPKPKRPARPKSKVGGARPGSGPKPKLGNGNVRTVIKTIRLSTGEHEAQQAAVRRGGIKDWAEWARPILNLAAAATNGNADVSSDPPEVGGQAVESGAVDADPGAGLYPGDGSGLYPEGG